MERRFFERMGAASDKQKRKEVPEVKRALFLLSIVTIIGFQTSAYPMSWGNLEYRISGVGYIGIEFRDANVEVI